MSDLASIYDYIIIGGGSAGCVLAYRLSADPKSRVLLVEAGPEDKSPLIHMPKGFGALLNDPKHAWQYQVEPHEGNGYRRDKWVRGKMLGGSSSINGMIYVRGQPEDYDGWETDLGLKGWGWSHVGAAFRAIENHELGDDGVRGVGGPQNVTLHPDRHPLSDAMIAAVQALGVPRNDDQNQPDQFSIGYTCRTIKGGRRQSAAVSFLKPARARPNLTVVTDTRVHRVVFDGKRAIGVDCGHVSGGGEVRRYQAAREVILCAGAMHSPQLLQLSGIGPAEHLQAHGIPVLVDAPGVGRNMREHWVAFQEYRLSQPISYNREFAGLGLIKNLLRYAFTRSGVLASSSHEVNGFLKTRPELARPDVQIHAAPFSLVMKGDTSTPAFDSWHGANMLVYPTRPESQGTVMIRSARPDDIPCISPNYLATENDRRTAIDAVRLVRRVFEQDALKPFLVDESFPGSQVQTDDEILDVYRRFGQTAYHAIGTCKMGADGDPMAVLDERLRVRGVSGLRVMDCSVMPTLVSANTNGPTMALAWRAADLILEDAR